MLLFRLISYLPFPVLYGLSSLLASLLNATAWYRRRVIENSLSFAFPNKSPEEIRKLRKEFYQDFTDVWLEALKDQNCLWKIS